MLSLKHNLIIFLLLIAGFIPSLVFAANTNCLCFCGDNKEGAKEASVETNGTECSTTCKEKGKQYVGCFLGQKNYPDQNDLCWTQAECEAYSSETITGVKREGEWGEQNYVCAPGSGYCYSSGFPVTLNVPILGQTQVSDFATYINLLYTYALPTAAIIAVVLAMIAGVQYATAGGNRGQVEKAKERLSNAIIGMVLLLSAYTIARLIDPRLVLFDALKVPLIKQVVIIDPDTTCDVLITYGFTVSPSSGKCGEKGTVMSIDKVQENVSNSTIKVGSTCPFLGCPNLGEACMSDGKCIACEYSAEYTASESVCSSIESLADLNDPHYDHEYICLFETDFFNGCTAVETNNDNYLNCSQLYSDAPSEDPCSVYENAMRTNESVTMSSSFLPEPFKSALSNVCADDTCGVSLKAGGGGCIVEAKTITVSAGPTGSEQKQVLECKTNAFVGPIDSRPTTPPAGSTPGSQTPTF